MTRIVCFFMMLSWMIGFPGAAADEATPPYRGTIFDFPGLVTSSDPTAIRSLRFDSQAQRRMFDRRTNRVDDYSVFVFTAGFSDGLTLEIAVNREFGSLKEAERQASFYGAAFGRLPLLLRKEIEALHIQDGKELFGGGKQVLIHAQMGRQYDRDGILEETLAHEAAHALDRVHARAPAWREAQSKDGRFISHYAAENPFREDIAESVIPFLVVESRPERFDADTKDLIKRMMGARMGYLRTLGSAEFPVAEDPETPLTTPNP